MTNIKTSIELSELVSNDNENHSIKTLAELFLAAMDDWPTKNLISIQDFISEFKKFYSEEITIEIINSKKINYNEDLNSWHLESGSYISDFLQESIRNLNEPNFDLAVQKVLNYYANLSL